MKNSEPNSNPPYNSFQDILEEYKFDLLLDDDNIAQIKEIISNLSEEERNIFLLYIDTGNYRKTSTLLGISITSVWLYIKQIKEKIIKELKNTN